LKAISVTREAIPLTPRNYRFFPIYWLVVLRSVANTIIGLALPVYLIFQEHMDPALVGVIYAIFTIAYIGGPAIAKPITQRIGIRNGLIIASILPVFTTGLMLVFFIPWVLILCRSIEGLTLGFFWPNAQMQVSLWQANAPSDRSEVMFRQYGYSWNFGCLLGGILGFLAVIITNLNFLGLIIGWLSIVIMVPLSLMAERPSTSIIFDGSHAFALYYKGPNARIIGHGGEIAPPRAQGEVPEKTSPNAEAHQPHNYQATALVVIPVTAAYFIQLVHGTIRSLYNFTYPLFLAQAGWPSYWAYLTISLQLILQMAGINFSSRAAPQRKYQWFLVGAIVCLTISTFMFATPDMVVITLLNIGLGFFNGLVYSLGSQIMLAHGRVTKSLKYATIYEIFSGMGYGITPLLAGFIADVNILINFEIVTGVIAIFLFAFCIATRNVPQKLAKPFPDATTAYNQK
jgi:MFS family permease